MIPEGATICTIDVVGLYPIFLQLEALRKAILGGNVDLPEEDLLALTKLVLENNYFEFGEKTYHQKLGTAIGTKLAPAYANIFMGDLTIECHFIESCVFKPWIWWHFLDDIFMIWLHGREKLESFLEDLNTFHQTIKFTWEISYKEIYFLDAMVTLENGCFTTDIYSKPTDTHQYLNYKSCDPPHVKRFIKVNMNFYCY